MVETDWREILSFSQRELVQADKDKLCENLSWMEADDIELNFTDLKTLFRLAQDILKYKSEQVNNLMGELEKANRKGSKMKQKHTLVESPSRTSDRVLETISQQEEVIKTNKKIIQQLYSDIAELEDRNKKYRTNKIDVEKDSDSSRDPLSEINATAQLENEIFQKNRHIRKLLSDVKVLEEVNVELKDKLTQLKDKLKEATQLIENLTEQLFSLNSERNQLKEALGKCEEMNNNLSAQIDNLKKDANAKDTSKENIQVQVKSKIQHLKNSLKTHKIEIDRLSAENTQLKEKLILASKPLVSPKKDETDVQIKIKELEVKLVEASHEIEQSAKMIQLLKTENKRLVNIINDSPDISLHENRNECDDGKERNMITKLKGKLKTATINLQATEELVVNREKELAEIATQLQLIQSEEGINTLLNRLKNKKQQLKAKDDGIKNFVIEINNLNQHIDELELENETLRQELKIPCKQKVPVYGVLKKYQDMEKKFQRVIKKFRINENKLVAVELDNRQKMQEICKLRTFLNKLGYDNKQINEILLNYPDENGFKDNTEIIQETNDFDEASINVALTRTQEAELQALIDENESLRVGLQEILDFLKDNSTTSSGILALKCPTLETICHAMDARHASGWYGPHMRVLMELKTALGGKDALLTALHESRKETFEVMKQLSEESKKSLELKQKLLTNKSNEKDEEFKETTLVPENCEINAFGPWIDDDEVNNIDFINKAQVENMIKKGNVQYDNKLKNSLNYFQCKFKALHDNLTSLEVTSVDNFNKWSVKEENYKAEIENLKTHLQQNVDDDTSILSPGLLSSPEVTGLERKIQYLEESYKHVRTQYENLNNKYAESKLDTMTMVANYETNIQNLLLCNLDLADKFRRCVPAELFWKQNVTLNEYITKYRNITEVFVKINIDNNELFKKLEEDKLCILNYFQKLQNEMHDKTSNEEQTVEKYVYEKQLQQVMSELTKKNCQIDNLCKKNEELQIALAKEIDTFIGSKSNKDENFCEKQLHKLREENNIIKQENKRLQNQLDITLLKRDENQHQNDNKDTEINLLRHQILDLQSTGDNKAIIARLSGEILTSHLQMSQYNKTIAKLTYEINKEKHMRADAEDMFQSRHEILNYYIVTNENKFRKMFEVLQILRQEYQGSLPLCTIESYLSNTEELNRKTFAVTEKLDEIENLRLQLMTKHSIYHQILEASKEQSQETINISKHDLDNTVKNEIQKQEIDLCNKKIQAIEQSRKKIIDRCNYLEETLILINQGFKFYNSENNLPLNNKTNIKKIEKRTSNSSIEIDTPSEDEASSSSKRNHTFTLPGSNIIMSPQKELKKDVNNSLLTDYHVTKNYEDKSQVRHKPQLVDVNTQTLFSVKKDCHTQTDEDNEIKKLQRHIDVLNVDVKMKCDEFAKAMQEVHYLTEKISCVNEEKCLLQSTLQNLTDSNTEKDSLISTLKSNIATLRNQIDDFKNKQYAQTLQENNAALEENRTLLLTLKELENEKNSVITEYTELLAKEREDSLKTVKDLEANLCMMQSQLDRRGTNNDGTNEDVILKEAANKYMERITELEDKCFKLQNDLNGCGTEIVTCQSELVRWKELAAERLSKMEQLSAQLKERHNAEVESYKAENQHWLSQLNDTQREHIELRSRLTEQKALYVKQLADKEAHIEQLRTVIQNLKTQIMNMQTMLSINDPSFDLSAIVEVEEASDAVSPQGSERLELKFESVVDLEDFQDDYMKMPTTSTAIWQEPLIERLRREKQLIGKQNAILRRQIKAVAARERRARLDAQNLKNQVFRITTSGHKVATVESAALQNKIASLQAQLTSARRDAQSTVAIWDKWKRAQQAAEKWQSRYEEKCQEEKKLETSLNLTKSALSRLEKEKRVLLLKLSELKSETRSVTEKQDDERSEKGSRSQSDLLSSPTPPVSTRALLDRIQAQQRRIAALEVAEKGNEPLVSEYEKSLAEITSLKGQVVKLESTLLELQIRTPLNTGNDVKPELEYWKSYCDMLKEENMQLTLRVNSLETTPTSAHQQRINDLEQTVLTLRGLVSKLQADQKSGPSYKRVDSRPSSGRSTAEKVRNQIDSFRTEISNLKRTIQEKDLLLERSKEMLKIAAEREDELLKENMLLRRRFDELVEHKGGFLSA